MFRRKKSMGQCMGKTPGSKDSPRRASQSGGGGLQPDAAATPSPARNGHQSAAAAASLSKASSLGSAVRDARSSSVSTSGGEY